MAECETGGGTKTALWEGSIQTICFGFVAPVVRFLHGGLGSHEAEAEHPDRGGAGF
jgi:hypothetical protein